MNFTTIVMKEKKNNLNKSQPLYYPLFHTITTILVSFRLKLVLCKFRLIVMLSFYWIFANELGGYLN